MAEAPTLPDNPLTFNDRIRDVPLEEVNHVKAPLELTFDGEKRYFEQVVQINNGDCVLASFLNTITIEATYQNGITRAKLPMEVTQAREYANELRKVMINPNTPNTHEFFTGFPDGDIMNLFSTIYTGSTFPDPKSPNYVRVDGSASSTVDAQRDAMELLDQLDDKGKYPSGIMAVGAQSHCQVIKRIDGGRYLLIDPAKHAHIDAKKFAGVGNLSEYLKALSIVSIKDLPETVVYLGSLFKGDPCGGVFFVQHPKGAPMNPRMVKG